MCKRQCSGGTCARRVDESNIYVDDVCGCVHIVNGFQVELEWLNKMIAFMKREN